MIFRYSENRLHGLDHLRALAIILVMIFHYGANTPGWLEPVRKFGWTGVDLFFVLSGYLIGYQLLKEYKNTSSIDFKRFYVKRFFRIIPAYLAVLVLYYSIGNLREGTGMPPLWRFLTFTQNYGLDTQTQKSFSHAWSLCVEEQFYLLLPITIILIFKSRLQKLTPILILTLIATGFIVRIYNWNEYVQPYLDNGNSKLMMKGLLEKVYYPSHNRMDSLLVGISIAAIFNFKPRIKNLLTKYGNFVLIIGIAIFLLASLIGNSIVSYKAMIYLIPLISLGYGFILIGAISPGSILYKIKSRITFIIATLSYAIYLTHKQLFHFIKLLSEKFSNEFLQKHTFWISIIIALIGGLILHFIIEKPFLRLRDIVLTDKEKSPEAKGKLILNYIKAFGNKRTRP